MERKPESKAKFRVPVVAWVFLGLFVVGGAGVWYLNRQSAVVTKPPALTPEAKAYVRNLKLADVDMKAHKSYVGQRVVEIVGKIGNQGEKPLKLVEINCVFYDPYGQVVLRERVPIVTARMGGLQAGEIKNFRLAFDNIPESWNQMLPQLVIANIAFG